VTIEDTKYLTLYVNFHILTLLITDNSEIVAVLNFNLMESLFIQWCFKVVTNIFLRYLHLWYLPTLYYTLLIMCTHSQNGIFCRNISVPWKKNSHCLVSFKWDAVEFVLMYRFSWLTTPLMKILMIVAISLILIPLDFMTYELLRSLYRNLHMRIGYEISWHYQLLQVCLSDDFCNFKKKYIYIYIYRSPV
jgi:hypothetical protein